MHKENVYAVLKKKHQDEFDQFPLGAAFNQEQFDQMMIKWGLYPSDTDKILSLGAGCYIRKADKNAYMEMTLRHQKEMQEAFDQDTTGTGFIYDAFYYELANHEYGYTGDLSEAVAATGISWKKINENPVYDMALRQAAEDVMYNTDW